MLKSIQKLMELLFKPEQKHVHEVGDPEKDKLKKDLKKAQNENAVLRKQQAEVREQINLWMRKSEQLQEKLTGSIGELAVLETVLAESNKRIESLELALELREVEEVEGLQAYIDELEAEIDEAIALITKYGLQMRKM